MIAGSAKYETETTGYALSPARATSSRRNASYLSLLLSARVPDLYKSIISILTSAESARGFILQIELYGRLFPRARDNTLGRATRAILIRGVANPNRDFIGDSGRAAYVQTEMIDAGYRISTFHGAGSLYYFGIK